MTEDIHGEKHPSLIVIYQLKLRRNDRLEHHHFEPIIVIYHSGKNHEWVVRWAGLL